MFTEVYLLSSGSYSKACEYGQQHEADALHVYSDSIRSTHPLFKLRFLSRELHQMISFLVPAVAREW